jgi:hypothetical protein
MMNGGMMLEGIREAFSQKIPAGVDQVWCADTSTPVEILFHDFTERIHAETL